MDTLGQTYIPDRWIEKILQRIDDYPIAQNAWHKLESAGLKEDALFLLFGYAGGAKDVFDRMHQCADDAILLLNAAVRADKLAQTNTPKRARNPDLFRHRATKARNRALASKWPIPSEGVLTLRDELERVTIETGTEPSLVSLREPLVKAAGKRSRMNRLYFLRLLKVRAAEHGVTLGLKALAALATCADPKHPKEGLDTGTLGRYLRDFPVRSR